MPITRSRMPQASHRCSRRRSCSIRHQRTGSQYQQRFNRIGHLCTGQPIVAVPPLPFDIEQPAFDEFGEVFARRLGRHIGSHRQLSCRQSEATHQSQQNCSSARIAQQVRGTGQFLVHRTIIGPKLFEYYGPRRTLLRRVILSCAWRHTLITLFLRYTIDPNKLSDIAKYAADEQVPIRESGGKILGYFMPTDFAGATNEAIVPHRLSLARRI